MLYATLTKEKLKVFKREMSEYIQSAKSSHIDEAIAAGFGKKSHAALLHEIGDDGWHIPVYKDEDDDEVYFNLPGKTLFWERLKELSPNAREIPLPPHWSGSSLIDWEANLDSAMFSTVLNPRDILDKGTVNKLATFIEALRREEHGGVWCYYGDGAPEPIEFGEISIYRAHAQSIGHDKGAIADVSRQAMDKAFDKAGLQYEDLHEVVEALTKEACRYSAEFMLYIDEHSVRARLYDYMGEGEADYINQLVWMTNKKTKDGDHFPMSDPK